MAGELLDLPVACIDFSPAPTGFFAAAVGDLFQAARAQVGLGPDVDLTSLDRWLTVVGAPPGWFPPECFRSTTHLFQPPDDPSDGGTLPSWFSELPGRTTVYVTLGTVFNETPGLFPMVFEAVSDLDANVVATVGKTVDPAGFRPLPKHVRVEQFIPQALVLPRCDAVIAHGGYGSLMGALRHGLPVVSVPLAAADNSLNARRVEDLSAGIAVGERARSSEMIGSAIRAVLMEPRYREAAGRVAAAMAALPPFTDAVGLIERLAVERKPVLIAS
jgi:UDP:flavonoid glycosyltransferase YjiC (YdhE family)